MEHHRALCVAVVAQAIRDIETADIGSTVYQAAAAFFTSAGEWRDSLAGWAGFTLSPKRFIMPPSGIYVAALSTIAGHDEFLPQG